MKATTCIRSFPLFFMLTLAPRRPTEEGEIPDWNLDVCKFMLQPGPIDPQLAGFRAFFPDQPDASTWYGHLPKSVKRIRKLPNGTELWLSDTCFGTHEVEEKFTLEGQCDKQMENGDTR